MFKVEIIVIKYNLPHFEKICLDSVKTFYGSAATYASMREKLDDNYLKSNNVNLKMSVFQEYQTEKKMLYV